MTELPDLSVAALAEAFASGAASPVEATRAVLERIDAWSRRCAR
jgi:Asp-tRNA(Asn)/Glu-tRNA(Gln) amidotransferase A subunit family amidase